MGDFAGVRLHVVTGKGGTGKTTVSAALALALAAGGRRVLLTEVEGRQGLAQLFDVPPLPYQERRLAVARGGGAVHGLAVDPEDALLEYLEMFYHLGRAGKALDRFGVTDFATTIAPGLRDVLLIGKIFEATRRTADSRSASGRSSYDAVVLDAPPTGRISRFLNVNTEVVGVAKVGPIRHQAEAIMRLLKSDASRVHFVTTLEEMPVQETLDGIAEMGRIAVPVGTVIVNMQQEPLLEPLDLAAAAAGEIDIEQVAASLEKAGITAGQSVLAGLLEEAAAHADRVELEVAQRRELDAAGVPLVTLPLLADGVDLGALYDLADRLGTDGTGDDGP